jgi:hypothetical protein
VTFTGKSKKMNKDTFISSEGPAIRLDFVNGETRTFVIPETLLVRFALHGAEQKFGDALAGLTDIDDGVLAIDKLIDRLSSGDENQWNSRKEGDSLAGTSILAKALVLKTGKTIEAIKAFLSTKTLKEKTALRNSPSVRPFVEKIEAERAAKGPAIDTSALLEELDEAAE